MLGQHVSEFIVLGLFVLSLVAVLAEILVKDSSALLDVMRGSAEIVRPNARVRAEIAEIHQFPAKRAEAAPVLRRAAYGRPREQRPSPP